MKTLASLAVVALLVALGGCAKVKTYEADFYQCGEPPDDTLFYCRPGTGPPRSDCTAVGSGRTEVAPITC